MIFLYAALNGFLDGVPVDLVSRYETELYSFLKSSLFYLPLHYELRSNLNVTLMKYILGLFQEYFIYYIVKRNA